MKSRLATEEGLTDERKGGKDERGTVERMGQREGKGEAKVEEER